VAGCPHKHKIRPEWTVENDHRSIVAPRRKYISNPEPATSWLANFLGRFTALLSPLVCAVAAELPIVEMDFSPLLNLVAADVGGSI
jgi:hypothetical protein